MSSSDHLFLSLGSLFHRAGRLGCGILCCVAALTAPLPAADLEDADWAHFRGPEYTGTNVADWPDSGESEVELVETWKVPLGPAFSALVVQGDRVYTGFAEDGFDWLGAFDAQTGTELWRLRFGDQTPAISGGYGGPVATPAVSEEHGLVFALGGYSFLVAADFEGTEIWRRDLSEWGTPGPFGFGSSPLVATHGGQSVVVVQAPSRDGTLLYGLDPSTGETVWSLGDDGAQYQSPSLLRLGGESQIVAVGAKFLYGVTPYGEIRWRHAYSPDPPSPKGRGSDIPVPLGEDRVLVKPTDTSLMAVEVRRRPGCEGSTCFETAELWRSRNVAKTYAPNVYLDGVSYGYKRSVLTAIDTSSGELLWGSRSPGEGFAAAADEYLVVMTKRGSLHLAPASRHSWEEAARLDLFAHDAWNEPIVAQGSIFVRSMGEMARVEVRSAEAKREAAWIETSAVGAALPDTEFGRFVRSLREEEDREAAVDDFLAGVESFPIVEGDWAHIVYRGPEEQAAVAGDMVGDRTEFPKTRVPGTDLFYFTAELPRDAWVGYLIHPGLSADGILDPLNPRATIWPREGSAPDVTPQRYSFFTMPEFTTPKWLEGEPRHSGRLETHQVDLAGLGVETSPPMTMQSVDIRRPGETQRIRVYLPARYDAGRSEPYPVVYVFAGDKVVEAVDAKTTLDHLLADELPAAVVVFVDRQYEFMDADAYWAFELHRRAFFERVRPAVEREYHVGPEVSYLSFGWGGPIALRTHQVPESAARRVAVVQPFVLDATLPFLVGGAAQVDPARRPSIYLETSRIGIRGAFEDWDVRAEQRNLVTALREQGWDVTMATNSRGFAWEAWKDRLGPALAFLLTGEAEVPTSEPKSDPTSAESSSTESTTNPGA